MASLVFGRRTYHIGCGAVGGGEAQTSSDFAGSVALLMSIFVISVAVADLKVRGRAMSPRSHSSQAENRVHTMSSGIATTLVLAGFALSLAGCGYSTGDRAASGALLGAGAGAAVGAVTGGSPLTGALIGGAIGGVGGAATSHNDINLGRPVWR